MLSFQECYKDVVRTIIDLLWSKWLASPTARQHPVGASTMQEVLAVFKKRTLSDSQKKQATFVHMMWRTLSPAMRARINRYELYLFMDSIDIMARRDTGVRGLISQPVASLISQLSILAECQRQFQLHEMSPRIHSALKTCPYKNGFPCLDVKILPDCAKFIRKYTVADLILTPWCKRAPPAYPVDQPRTKGRVKKLCDAEAVLDRLWAAIDSATSPWTEEAKTIRQSN